MNKLCRGPKGLEKLVGLATRKCVLCEKGDVQPMDESSAYKLRNQVSHKWKLKAWHTPVTSNMHLWRSRTVTSCCVSAKHIMPVNSPHKSHCTSSAPQCSTGARLESRKDERRHLVPETKLEGEELQVRH